ncbi:MAG TPA: large conductance mechanosensitive channel protein MscL [Patescibacteria group bacterium]
MLQGFKKFILRGNVVDLAVGVVIGAAFNTVIQSFVKDILTPLIAIVGGQPDFSAFKFTIRNSSVTYGDFVNSFISFLIISAVIYFLVVMPMNRLMALTQKKDKDAKPETKTCPECLSDIPYGAKRCKYCTAELTKPKH